MTNATTDRSWEMAADELDALFTPGAAKRTARVLLQHRLDIPDCIAECIADELPPERFEAQYASVLGCIDTLNRLGFRAAVEAYGAELVGEILIDCCDGSTYFGNADEAVLFGEIAASTLARHREAAREVARVVAAFTGQPVHFCQN